MTRRLTTVFFDAGNTLVLIDFPLVARLIGGGVTAEQLAAAEPRLRRQINRYYIEQGPEAETPHIFDYTFSNLARLGGFPIVPAAIERLRAETKQKTLWRLVNEDARGIPGRLRERGYRTAVISNADGRVHELLDELGYAGQFEVVVDSGREGVVKPMRRIFEIGLERMGVTAAESVYIGDYPVLDVYGAAAAGYLPVLYDPDDTFGLEMDEIRRKAPETRRIRRMDELFAILAEYD